MSVKTIEAALQSMGETLSQPGMAKRAREAIDAGDVLEITIRVGSDRQGAVVSMSSVLASQRESHGRLIRLE